MDYQEEKMPEDMPDNIPEDPEPMMEEVKDFVTGKPLPYFGDDMEPDPELVAQSIKSAASSIFAVIFFVVMTLFCGYLLFWNIYVSVSVRKGDNFVGEGTYYSAVQSYAEACKRAVNMKEVLPISAINFSAGRNTFVKYIEAGEKYFGSQSAMEHITDRMSLESVKDSRLLAVIKRAQTVGEAQELIDGIKQKYVNGDFADFCNEIDKAKQDNPDYPPFTFELSKLEMAAQIKQPDEKQLELFEELRNAYPEKINFYIGYGIRAMVRIGQTDQAVELCKEENADDGAITEMRLYICRMNKDYNRAASIYSSYRYKNSFVNNVDREVLITYLLKNNKNALLELLKRYSIYNKTYKADAKLLYVLEIASIDCGKTDYYEFFESCLKKNDTPQSANVEAFKNKTKTKEAIFLDFNGEFG
ncbi:MAG: hypothetical protein K5756_06005 [Clostridiales bacterium]|nr:hypothetical protein [Clostridiales bacterium]